MADIDGVSTVLKVLTCYHISVWLWNASNNRSFICYMAVNNDKLLWQQW